ncbi:VWA domain-containing protein [Nostoc sp. TCL26-01]|uniref:vWA domain-containing protein n=1 Tax=Nostoc sp. TCL26-01 TaxID=2576904 RepID=UPI0015BD56C1|nr:VWA domain-containing protein [Nostoc sp. TCL26-01]QLE58577.1 VWA domain-containing protein [Nostoc sp. TCL26-01]
MKVQLLSALSDSNIDATQLSSQRQLAISVCAIAEQFEQNLPLNLCLILDQSGSMQGKPLKTVIAAVEQLVDRLQPGDRLSVVSFAGSATVIIPNQIVEDPETIKSQINQQIQASGGTVIAEGLQQGITELMKGTRGAVSQVFLLTDGRGESSLKIWRWEIGNDDYRRCLELARKAAKINITINTLGFGNSWHQDLLETIADVGGGTLTHIEYPEQVVEEFNRLFSRVQSIGLTNAYLVLSFAPHVRLAQLKPMAQISPDIIELPVQPEANGTFVIRLGDLMRDMQRIVLANLYLGKLPAGEQVIGNMQVRYDHPGSDTEGLLSPTWPIYANIMDAYQADFHPQVHQWILALAKYRQTQLAETKLQQGDRSGAATMLQTAAKTALQIGDTHAATILQTSATRLQSGEKLSAAELKKTRIVSKTILQE